MGPRNYSCTNNSHITISDNWLRTSAVIHNVLGKSQEERVQDVYLSLHTVYDRPSQSLLIPSTPQHSSILTKSTKFEEFNISFGRIMSSRNAHVLIGEDFNCGDIEWSTMQGPQRVQKRHTQQELLDIISVSNA